MSKELEKISSGNDEKTIFPEHSFIASCLRVGLTMNDLKILTYVDVMKIFVSLLPQKEEQEGTSQIKQATQKDIDRLLM